MTNKASYLVQVMEKIGSPLIASVNDVSARLRATAAQSGEPQADNPSEDATKIAALMNKSVQLAISMSQLMDLSQEESEADSIRLALTALAGPILANQYRMSTRLPGDGEIKKIVSSLEAVMTFSDNFGVAADAEVRLENIDKDFFPADEAQIQILYIQALVPTVNAIVAFPFGMPERKLVQDVTERLLKKASDIRKVSYPDLTESSARKSELAILRSLATIYSQCHFGEMARLMSLPPEQRENQPTSLDPVWAAFEARANMLEILSQEILPAKQGAVGATAQNREGQIPGTETATGSNVDAIAVSKEAEQAPSQPQTQQSQQPQQQQPQQQQPQQQQQSQPAEQTASQSPPGAPASQPASQEAVDNSDQSQDTDSSSGNPMAFFKKPKTSDDDQSN